MQDRDLQESENDQVNLSQDTTDRTETLEPIDGEEQGSTPPLIVEEPLSEPSGPIDVDQEAASSDPVEVEDAVSAPAPAEPAPATAEPEAEAPEEVEDEDGDEEEEDTGPDLFLPGDWYVVHTYAGYENKVKANLASRISSMAMEDKIFDVVVPTEEVMELKQGKKQLVQRKVFPGYILVRMLLDDDSWYVVRNTPGVTGFVGPTGAKPTPLEHAEVAKILAPKEEERLRPRLEFEEGEVVSVISGAFNGMSGPISEINTDQQTVKVLVDIFGRETPVTLPFDHVAKL